jgi:L-lactate dehydrogenase complex protein LldG
MPDDTRQARDAILGRVRQSLTHPARLPQAAEVPTPPATQLPFEREALIKSFAAELSRLHGVFHRVPPADAPGLVLDLIAEAGGDGSPGVLAWDKANLPVPGLLEAVRAGGVRLLGDAVPLAEPERTARLAEMEKAIVGLTGADAALADVGAIVVRSGGGRPRLASLLPPTHIALVTPDQFFPSLYDWMESLRAQGRLDETAAGVSNLTVITGPSRTADIEKTLVLGMHGPRMLHVICVEEA